MVGAPKQKITKVILQAKQVGVGAPAKRISSRNSTSKASWEWTTNLKEFCPTPCFFLLETSIDKVALNF
ncbi:hypothetical protein BUZ17_08370 [Staphylococcus borealis]|nr:hypothetical protein BUZ17_08370 [Staphylococcus borealis]